LTLFTFHPLKKSTSVSAIFFLKSSLVNSV